MAEYSVHYESYTAHITATLKNCKKEEENEHLRNEAENCTETGYDTVINKTEEPRCKMWFKEFFKKSRYPFSKENIVYPVGSYFTNPLH